MLACEHTYDRFTDFKRRVLEPARKELKETCDIYFTYTVERNGRSPSRVNFAIKRKDQVASKASNPPQPHEIEDRTRQEGNGAASGPVDINVYAMVVDDMTQEELNRHKESDIRAAVDAAKKKAQDSNPDDGAALQASKAWQLALQALR